jgi:hypothetical protein
MEVLFPPSLKALEPYLFGTSAGGRNAPNDP